jgi:hypothetical protein
MVVQHPINSLRNYLVNDEKVNAEQNDRDDHHCRSGLNFFSARKSNFPHFIADISQKTFRTRGKLHHSIALIFARDRYCLCHWSLPSKRSAVNDQPFLASRTRPALSNNSKILAGAEGFEPPSPVLETGSLAVELTPLFFKGSAIHFASLSVLRPHALLALYGARFTFHPACSSI